MSTHSSVLRVSDLPTMPSRPADSHKGTFGRVTIIAGSQGMSGAACLAGVAALRGGAGLVTVACPQPIQSIVAGYEPSLLTLGLPAEAGGSLGRAAWPLLEEQLDGQDAAALGPGCGKSIEFQALAAKIYSQIEMPIVIDADGLNVLARFPEWPQLGHTAGPRVLTPHHGEFMRMTGRNAADVERLREDLAIEFSLRTGAIVVLKGSHTVVTNGRQLYVNTTGNNGLATGGTGDVLTGLMTALLGQKLPPFEAARLAVYVHGLAGDLAVQEFSQPGLIASDLPLFIARAWRMLGG